MDVLKFLQGFTSPGKLELFDKLIEERTNHITVVLEDVFQSHNASAVLRSCDCFGIQNMHIIENDMKYILDPDVAVGASKWVDMNMYQEEVKNTEKCIEKLKADGYKIIATTPHKNDFYPSTLPLDDKVAFVFGNEKDGISDTIHQKADGFMRIPMYGFTESYNISVSVALTLYEVTKRLRESDVDWQLNEQDKFETLLKWTKSAVKASDLLIEEFNKTQNKHI